MLKNQISAVSTKSNVKNDGYCVVFEDTTANKEKAKATFPPTVTVSNDDEKEIKVPSKKPMSPKSPRSPNSPMVSVEVISSTESEVVLRCFHVMDKYIDGCADKGPKGYKIDQFHKMFGDEFKNAGIDIGWKLMKI